ncbi:Fur family transcriptional regulator [Microbispora sp. KK1-11]|uniref:Fur family transcriptional regulator n=1 Tax=Microbispora sp. KK1-11 TaxID=2053005 RepID=UPI0011578C0A|nr:Fur family transcriptional regulator [Microbispora sp. KK1-11]TQS25698.1 transcriptional repressor [Microbispora sp. KK1-11]
MDDAGRLRQAGLRVTAARLAIMQTVCGGDHLDVEAIHRGVCERVGQVSLQAVYDSLNALQRGGLLRRIEPAGSPTRYETRVGDNHHHLVCRSCGRVTDVDCAVGHAPCLEPASDAGYLVDEADVIYWGLCPPCRPEAGSAQPDSARV